MTKNILCLIAIAFTWVLYPILAEAVDSPQVIAARAAMNKATSFKQNGSVCKPIIINLDLNGDGTKEKYNMTSLLFCNGRNYVTPIKDQVGGTCLTYATVAALETTAYIRHDHLWPPTSMVPQYTNFSPIDLSEGIAMNTNEGPETQELITNMESWYGAPFGEFLRDPEYVPWWWKKDEELKRMAEALENRAGDISPLCQNLRQRFDSALTPDEQARLIKAEASLDQFNQGKEDKIYSPEELETIGITEAADDVKKEVNKLKKKRIKLLIECELDYTKKEQMVFITPSAPIQKIPSYCKSPFGTISSSSCSTPCKNLLCLYKPDYKRTDLEIKKLISKGFPMVTSISWVFDGDKSISVPSGMPYYDFKVISPKKYNDKKFDVKYGDGYTFSDATGVKHNFNRGLHAVLIVGYLQSTDGKQTYWIIKNSWGEKAEDSNKDVFNILRVAGDFASPVHAGSTQVNLYLNGQNKRYSYYSDVCLARLDDLIQDASGIKCDDSLWQMDEDDDDIFDLFDNCPLIANPDQKDSDGDHVGDECDLCPEYYDRYQDKSLITFSANDLNADNVPDVCRYISNVKEISAGGGQTCALLNDGRVMCWGPNPGDGSRKGYSPTPVETSNLTAVSKISAGGLHICALLKDGNVMCWGRNNYGQLGNKTIEVESNIPIEVPNLAGVAKISAGGDHTCVLLKDGKVMCWGRNSYGQLGDGTRKGYSYMPIEVSNLTGVATISAGDSHTCASLNNGKVMCWGLNSFGQLGNGTNIDSNIPVEVSNLTGVTEISAGGSHTCASLNDGKIMCWGRNNYGQLGDGTKDYSNTPVEVFNLTDVAKISAGFTHTCALLNDGKVVCWGCNTSVQLGDGTTKVDSNIPVKVFNLTDVAKISAGGSHTCASLNNGKVMCWGGNLIGQLGNDGAMENSNIPVTVK